ncbi:MAG: peptidase MA family metallohydrolase [Pirellula sp.]
MRCVLCGRLAPLTWFAWTIVAMYALAANGFSSELDDARDHLKHGRYQELIDLSRAQVEKKVWNEAWPRFLVEGYLAIGKYEEAKLVYENALDRFGDSLRLRMLGPTLYRFNNESQKANDQTVETEAMIQRAPWRYSNKSELVPLGEFFLLRGEDPKQVLKLCFDQALKTDPNNVEAHVATARMAIQKNDAQVAAQAVAKALQRTTDDPEIHYLAARAWADDDEKATASLQRSLEINPNYIPSLILAAESQIHSESYLESNALLDRIEKINPKHPRLWALRAVIAHLLGDYSNEGEFRSQGLQAWKLNPEVDHSIGKHLSMHYRFQEGATYQRRALAMDPNFGPARAQLAQDLLRLGELSAGWELVDSIRQSDPYDVSIFNLKQLQSRLEKFATIEIPGFVIRMDAKEAKIYGDDVVALLSEARQTLATQYAVELEEPIYVEIFPRQQEFAIRTFGLPGGQGFLGVCFGRLITANSPAALRVDSSWKSVLWHEYCHVITLQKTKNRMPRWLSEGISVYEERQRDPTWGQSMDPEFREMLLGEDFVPISKLSSAFLRPKSPMHLQLAYFTSSLAVEFWVEQWGIDGLRKLLDDLAMGVRINDAIGRFAGSLDVLDQQFENYVRSKAQSFASGADFEKPNREQAADMDAWMQEHPNSYWGSKALVRSKMDREDWKGALDAANHLRDLWPDDSSDTGVYAWLAEIQRKLDDTAAERSSLLALAERNAAPVQALLRLAELDSQAGDWSAVNRWCERLQGAQPMLFETQSRRAVAAEKSGEFPKAAAALRSLLEMDPVDPSQLHFRLSQAYWQMGDVSLSKRYCLMALEESPRYFEALAMLQKFPKQAPPLNK